jgi:hypothetical protein
MTGPCCSTALKLWGDLGPDIDEENVNLHVGR